jgi:hypothetical protein
MKNSPSLALITALTLPSASPAEISMAPLSGFAGDGWLAPGEVSWLSGTAATERSIAYSAVADHLYVASRVISPAAPLIRILNAATGAEINAGAGGVNVTGISGGTFPVNCVGVAEDGVLYACNLASPVSATAPFQIYRWADIASPPAVIFGSSEITLGRMGDTLDVIGSGTNTRIVAGESNSSGAGTRNGYAIIRATETLNFSGSLVTFVDTPAPGPGDFRLGITFTDASSVIGTQGSGGIKFTSFSGTTGTLVRARNLTNTSERPMDYIVLGGKPLLATIETNGNAAAPPDTFNTVRVYDLTNPAAPALAASGRTAGTWLPQGTSGPGTGSVQWGKVTGNSATLYALSTNNGIQAFTVTVAPPPLEFSSIDLTPGGIWNLAWFSTPGHSYRLEASGNLVDWTSITAGLPAGAGATTSYAWTVPAEFTRRAQVRVILE